MIDHLDASVPVPGASDVQFDTHLKSIFRPWMQPAVPTVQVARHTSFGMYE